MYQEAYNRMVKLADDIMSGLSLSPEAAAEKTMESARKGRNRVRGGLASRLNDETQLKPEAPTSSEEKEDPVVKALEQHGEMLMSYFRVPHEPTAMQKYNAEQKAKGPLKEVAAGVTEAPTRPPFGELTFYDLVDKYEGGGSYDALLANSEKSIFKGIQPSEMTIGELKKFADEKYNEASMRIKKTYGIGNPNIPSTPIGRYQFVITTIGELAEEMGMTDETPFAPKIQDMMFRYYLNKRLSRSDTQEGKRKQLRAAWDGFKKATDAELDTAIRNIALL